MSTEIDKELEDLWLATEELIDEIKRNVHRASCRIGSTIEMKNDKKRVEEAYDLIRDELDPLSALYFEESGRLEQAKLQQEMKKVGNQ